MIYRRNGLKWAEKLLYYTIRGEKMYDHGFGNINDMIEAMYDYYVVQCIAEDIEPILKMKFNKAITRAYDCYVRNIKKFIEEDKVIKVYLNIKNEKPFLWVEMSGDRIDNIEMFLVRNPKEV